MPFTLSDLNICLYVVPNTGIKIINKNVFRQNTNEDEYFIWPIIKGTIRHLKVFSTLSKKMYITPDLKHLLIKIKIENVCVNSLKFNKYIKC